jgi:hypothetical protein
MGGDAMMSEETARTMADVLETCVTPQHPRLYSLDLLSFHTNEAQIHLQKDVLHREVRRHASNRDNFILFALD